MTLISTPGLVDLTVGWMERYLAASSPFEMDRQARMTREALRVMYSRAASRPRPAFPPVMITVWPVKLVPAGVGGMGGWPMVRGRVKCAARVARYSSVSPA